MAIPKTLSTNGVSTSVICPLNVNAPVFSATVFCTVTGSATYTVQITGDNCYTATPTNWFDHPDLSGATASGTAEITSPVSAVRINQTAGAGSVSARVIQSN